MRFNLRHQAVERLGGRRHTATLCKGEIAEAGRAQREVKRQRNDRQSHERHHRRGAAQLDARCRRRIALTVGRGQQTTADFDVCGLCLRRANLSRGKVAIDLGQLIPVDGRFAAIALRPATATQRPEHGEDRSDCHQREHKPQCH